MSPPEVVAVLVARLAEVVDLWRAGNELGRVSNELGRVSNVLGVVAALLFGVAALLAGVNLWLEGNELVGVAVLLFGLATFWVAASLFESRRGDAHAWFNRMIHRLLERDADDGQSPTDDGELPSR